MATQIKGTTSANQRITDAFRAKGEEHYLVRKIVTFTKVKDYFFMTVFPEAGLEDFGMLQASWQETAVQEWSIWVYFKAHNHSWCLPFRTPLIPPFAPPDVSNKASSFKGPPQK